MNESVQLTITGGAVSIEHSLRTSSVGYTPLSAAQRAILDHITTNGSIRTTQAGFIMHRHRKHDCRRWNETRGEAMACCEYAAADGLDAMKRLEKRGLVRKSAPGVWI